MIQGKKVLAYIPARSGSKGLPYKNIKLLGGIPLLAHSIKAAKQSQYVDQVILSTDSEEYAAIGKEYGAVVPFIRPAELAQDHTIEADVIIHLINWLKENNQTPFDIIVKLQPTSPLRTAVDIDRAIELLLEKEADSVIGVCETAINPLWTNTLPEDGSMRNFIKRESIDNRQQLGIYYELNGAVYVSTPEMIIKNQGWFGANPYAYIMPRERSVDIDEHFDLEFAEFLLTKKKVLMPESDKTTND